MHSGLPVLSNPPPTGYGLSIDASAVVHTDPYPLAVYTNSGTGLFVKTNGRVGIGTTTPQHKLDVNGDIGSGGTVYHSSDSRWKKNIQTIPDALEKVTKMRGAEFEWRKDEFKEKNFSDGKKLGFIAQEVEKVVPELVSEDIDGYKSVSYANITALLVEAVKEQQKTIASLQAQVEQQNVKLSNANAELNKLRSENAEIIRINQKMAQLEASINKLVAGETFASKTN